MKSFFRCCFFFLCASFLVYSFCRLPASYISIKVLAALKVDEYGKVVREKANSIPHCEQAVFNEFYSHFVIFSLLFHFRLIRIRYGHCYKHCANSVPSRNNWYIWLEAFLINFSTNKAKNIEPQKCFYQSHFIKLASHLRTLGLLSFDLMATKICLSAIEFFIAKWNQLWIGIVLNFFFA